MRILTVRQPWAWAIIHGGKDVENRVRNIAGEYRGPVAIHAAKVNDVEAWTALGRTNLAAYSRSLDAVESLIGGAIIGVVDLTDVHVCKSSVQGFMTPVCFDPVTPVGTVCSAWGQFAPNEEIHHLELANPRALSEPIPFKGALGLRNLDDETVARIERALA